MTEDEAIRQIHRLRVYARARLQSLYHGLHDPRNRENPGFWDDMRDEAREAADAVGEIRRVLANLGPGR